MPGRIITVAIEKGGAGKTTTAVHLAFFAAESGMRVLLVDLDTQGNASDTVAAERPPGHRPASDLYEPIEPVRPILTVAPHLDLLPADDRLHGVERLPMEEAVNFRSRLIELAMHYDLIVIDTPPSATYSTLFPLMASDYVLAPILPHDYSISGAKVLLGRVDQIRRSSNRSLQFVGLLINNWNRRDTEQNEIVDEFQRNLTRHLVPHVIGASSALARVARRHRPVWYMARWGSQRRAARDVRTAMKWVLERTGVIAGAAGALCVGERA